MKIQLSPVAASFTTSLLVSGDALIVDGTKYDLSSIPEGGDAIAEGGPFIGPITRTNGVISCTVRYEYESAAAIPNQSPDIADYLVEVESGEVPSPIVWKETEEEGYSDV